MSDCKARWGSGFKRILDDLVKDGFEDDFQRECEALMLENAACEKIKEEEKSDDTGRAKGTEAGEVAGYDRMAEKAKGAGEKAKGGLMRAREEKIGAMRETADVLREAVEVVANAVESARDGDKGRQERIPALMALMMRAVQMFYFDVQALGYDHAPLMGKESKGEKNA